MQEAWAEVVELRLDCRLLHKSRALLWSHALFTAHLHKTLCGLQRVSIAGFLLTPEGLLLLCQQMLTQRGQGQRSSDSSLKALVTHYTKRERGGGGSARGGVIDRLSLSLSEGSVLRAWCQTRLCGMVKQTQVRLAMNCFRIPSLWGNCCA